MGRSGADPFIAKLERENRLFEQFAHSPVVDLTGVVAASGAGACRMQGQERWTMKFTFDAWRVGDGDVCADPILVQWRVTEPEIKNYVALVKPNMVFRIKARIVSAPGFEGPQGHLETILGADPDPELGSHAARLREPVHYEDAVFGTLTLDRSLEWYRGRAVWCGAEIEVDLDVGRKARLDGALATAHTLWRDQVDWDERAREFAASILLQVKNESWLDDGATLLSAGEFREKMSMDGVVARADGAFDLWYSDGDLFWGHSIRVSGSLSGGLTDAGIEG